MILAKASFDILNQLSQLVEQLEDEEYTSPLPVISNNTLGKHVRHIIEFYICLLNGLEEGVIDYDSRKRDLKLETEREYVLGTINALNNKLIRNSVDSKLTLCITAALDGSDKISVDTTLFRELSYNIEHAIHHFAIIKIAIENSFKDVALPENFGVAHSTVKFQNQCAQ